MSSDQIAISSLEKHEQDAFNECWKQLRDKAPRNQLRAAYYDGKNAVRDLGISTPPHMRRIALVLGWSAKAVDTLNRRCKLEGFTTPSDELSATVEQIMLDNLLAMEAPQAGVSSLIHSTAFLVTTQGDEGAGEPPVIITAKDALSGTGVWDRRRRVLRNFLSVIETDKDGDPTEFVLYMPDVNVFVTRNGYGWDVDRREHSYGVPVEPLVYQPRLARPFGSSRISRAVMSLHDSALRTVLRSEVTAELYSVAQRVLLGADESAFTDADGNMKTMWQAVLGRVWAMGRDEEGNVPDIKEFSSAPQTPHVEQLRTWAALFAGETSIPITSLGIATDSNPTSAQAYEASREDLFAEAEGTTDGWSPAWRRTMARALSMYEGTEAPEINQVRPKWRDVRTPSRAAAADAAGKTIEKFPWLANSELGLELYGFDQDFLDRAKVELRRQRGSAVLDILRGAATNVVNDGAGSTDAPA